MADYAEGFKDENGNSALPPPELLQAFKLEKWGAQALYDKPIPSHDLVIMSACLNVYQAFMSYRAGQKNIARWAENNPAALDLVNNVRKLRLEHG